MFLGRDVPARSREIGAPISLISLLSCAFLLVTVAQAQQTPGVQDTVPPVSSQSIPAPADTQQPIPPQTAGSIAGTVLDQVGAVAVGAEVQLTSPGRPAQKTLSGDNGQFSFADVPPGPFQLTVTAGGFQSKVFSGSLNPGQAYLVPAMVLAVAPATTNVRVGVSNIEVAEAQIKQQEKQRVLGIAPNFYVSYIPDAAPLNSKQKFELAWKSTIDPVTIVGVGFLAGLEQAADDYGGYGQGAQGYAKRFGAAYANTFIGTFMDSAIFPSIFKQDPRYFYQGTGTTKSRLLHALSNAVIRRSDDGRSQPNYSAIAGSFATAAISYSYYPPSDRSGGLLVQNALVSIAGGAVAGVFQEFVLRKLTTHAHDQGSPKP